MKTQKLLILAITLLGCTANTQTSPLSKQVEIILNVNYALQPKKVVISKNYENQVYTWEYDYAHFNQIYTDYSINREIIPTEYSLSTEKDYYSCYNIFYNYGSSCVIVMPK